MSLPARCSPLLWMSSRRCSIDAAVYAELPIANSWSWVLCIFVLQFIFYPVFIYVHCRCIDHSFHYLIEINVSYLVGFIEFQIFLNLEHSQINNLNLWSAAIQLFSRSPSQNSGMFFVCILSEVCFFACLWKWLGSKACFRYVLCMFVVCFNINCSHSLQYYWFPLTN